MASYTSTHLTLRPTLGNLRSFASNSYRGDTYRLRFRSKFNSPPHAQTGSDSRTAVRNCCSRRHTPWQGESPISALHFGWPNARWLDTAMQNTRAETSLLFAILSLAYWSIVNSRSSKCDAAQNRDKGMGPENLICESGVQRTKIKSLAARILRLQHDIGRGAGFSTQSYFPPFFRAPHCNAQPEFELEFELVRGLAKFILASNCIKRVCKW